MTAHTSWESLEQAARHAERGGGLLGVTVIGPAGERFDRNGERRFVAASTVKIPIMVTLFREIDAGRRRLTETTRLKASDRASGSGVLLHLHENLELTIGDLAYLMISISDNTATNILIELLGVDKIGAVVRDLGMAGSTIAHKMRGEAVGAGESENWAVPQEYASLIVSLLKGQAASPASCAEMTTLLEKQQNDRRIARYLPSDNRPRWGSKTGSLPSGVVNDVGFVSTPRGDVVLSVFGEKLDRHRGEEAIGAISRAALEALG